MDYNMLTLDVKAPAFQQRLKDTAYPDIFRHTATGAHLALVKENPAT